MSRLSLWLLLGCAALAAGCASLTSQANPSLGNFHRVFVETRLNDNLGIDRLLVAELKALGYEAQQGPLTMMPENYQLVVTYDAREEWDLHQYLIELSLSVRPAKDYNIIAASGRYFRPGVTRRTPQQMVHELVPKVFPPARHAKTK